VRGFHLFLMCFGLMSSNLIGQNQSYTAFGQDPTRLADSLYINLNTTNIVDRLTAITALGDAHFLHGNTDSVAYYGNYLQDQVIRYRTDVVNSDDYLAQSYLLIGYGQLMNGLKDEALASFIEGIELNNPAKHHELQLGLAIVYKEKGAFDKSISLLKECFKAPAIATRLHAKKQFGDILLARDEWQEANQIYEEVLHSLTLDQTKLYLQTKLNQGSIATKRQKYDQAIRLLDEVSNSALEQKYYDVYIEAVIQTGKVYSLRKDYESAQIVLSIAHVNAIGWERLSLEQEVLKALTMVNVAKEDYKNAYALMTQYVSVINQIKNKQNHQAIRDLEIKYQTTVKENEILSLKEEQLVQENNLSRQKTIKNAILIGFLILLIPIIALLVVYYQKLQVQSALAQQQEELNKQQVSALLQEQELKLVKASVNAQNEERSRIAMELHDSIGGNLAAIKLQLNQDNQKDNGKLLAQIDETYTQVREISHNLAPTKLVENAFTNVIDEYISNLENTKIHEIKFVPYPLDKVNKIEDAIKINLFKIIQELLTNTIKYANADHVEIHLNVFEKSIHLLYEDDGDGFDVKHYKKGLGIQNIKRRLDPLHAEFNIDSALQRGTVVTIEIPIP